MINHEEIIGDETYYQCIITDADEIMKNLGITEYSRRDVEMAFELVFPHLIDGEINEIITNFCKPGDTEESPHFIHLLNNTEDAYEIAALFKQSNEGIVWFGWLDKKEAQKHLDKLFSKDSGSKLLLQDVAQQCSLVSFYYIEHDDGDDVIYAFEHLKELQQRS